MHRSAVCAAEFLLGWRKRLRWLRAWSSARSSGTGLAADALIVDVPPKVGVVLGIRHRNLFSCLLLGRVSQIQFGDVDVEPVDVVEEPVGIVDDSLHRRVVTVAGLH